MNKELNLAERGRDTDGQPIFFDRRLYMQLLAFKGQASAAELTAALKELNCPAVLYADINDPYGWAAVTASEDPDFFTGPLRALLQQQPFANLEHKPELTMFGRTYSIGYEQDLEHTVINRSLQRLLNPKWPWAVWYPLRRSGAFEQLDVEEKKDMMKEHAHTAMAYTQQGYCYDVRLACHGLDTHDNDFVLGLLGADLLPLSRIVQDMRSTRQTSEFIESIGPFFIGKAVWQSTPKATGHA